MRYLGLLPLTLLFIVPPTAAGQTSCDYAVTAAENKGGSVDTCQNPPPSEEQTLEDVVPPNYSNPDFRSSSVCEALYDRFSGWLSSGKVVYTTGGSWDAWADDLADSHAIAVDHSSSVFDPNNPSSPLGTVLHEAAHTFGCTDAPGEAPAWGA